jgi:integrase
LLAAWPDDAGVQVVWRALDGVNTKALSTYMGHAAISITLDRYGHLMPGNENEAAALLDAYLEQTSPALPKAMP